MVEYESMSLLDRAFTYPLHLPFNATGQEVKVTADKLSTSLF